MVRTRKGEAKPDSESRSEEAVVDPAKTAEEVRARAAEFLKAMYAAEESISRHRTDLSREQWKQCISSILQWLDTTDELPKACLTRDVGREILAQLSAVVMISGYRGDPGTYIA